MENHILNTNDCLLLIIITQNHIAVDEKYIHN